MLECGIQGVMFDMTSGAANFVRQSEADLLPPSKVWGISGGLPGCLVIAVESIFTS